MLFLAGCPFWATVSFGEIPGKPGLLHIELLDDGVKFELSRSAKCKVAGVTGFVSTDKFNSLWSRLVDDAGVSGLDKLDIMNEIKQEIERTGLVGNVGPTDTTRLTLQFQDKTKTITLYNVAATHKMYPRAEKLARYNQARLVLRELNGKCDPDRSIPNETLKPQT